MVGSTTGEIGGIVGGTVGAGDSIKEEVGITGQGIDSRTND